MKLGADWNEEDIREAKAVALGAKQREKLDAAEAIATAFLKAKATPKVDDVLTVLQAIGNNNTWPKQTRPNLADAPVSGMCVGLVFALGGGGAKVSLISENYPAITKLIVAWCRDTLPKTRDGNEFPFSSVQINFNYAAKKHVDGNNIGPSYIQSIGPHTGTQNSDPNPTANLSLSQNLSLSSRLT